MTETTEKHRQPAAPAALIILMWAVVICAVATTGYFLADYLAASSELSVLNRQIHSLEVSL